MTYATILLHVQQDARARRRLAFACDLACRFDASITGVAVEMIRAAPFDDGYTSMQPQWFDIQRDMAMTRREAGRVEFDAAAAGVPSGSLWIAGLDFPSAALARASRGADLIVTSRATDGRADANVDAAPAELALISGRPVLIAPSTATRVSAERIVLAWKDSREARRAASDAMPFLTRAQAVVVLEVCAVDQMADAEVRVADVVAWLKRHGVAAEGKVRDDRLSAGREILDEAKENDADLIVSGAYGHSRLGEWVFGGVTRDLLKQDERSVLLSH